MICNYWKGRGEYWIAFSVSNFIWLKNAAMQGRREKVRAPGQKFRLGSRPKKSHISSSNHVKTKKKIKRSSCPQPRAPLVSPGPRAVTPPAPSPRACCHGPFCSILIKGSCESKNSIMVCQRFSNWEARLPKEVRTILREGANGN